MLPLPQMEPNRHAPWVSVGIRVGDVREPGGVAEADPDGGASVVEVRGGGECGSFFGRGEGSADKDAFGVG